MLGPALGMGPEFGPKFGRGLGPALDVERLGVERAPFGAGGRSVEHQCLADLLHEAGVRRGDYRCHHRVRVLPLSAGDLDLDQLQRVQRAVQFLHHAVGQAGCADQDDRA